MNEAEASHRDSVLAGPVSAALLAGLREEARTKGTLVWLDKDGRYTEWVDSLRAKRACGGDDFPYPLLAYRGSFLELMLELEGHPERERPDPPPLVVHMPGFNSESIETTPMLATYRAGQRYWVRLEKLFRDAAAGKATPAAIDSALESELGSLAEADRRLAAILAGHDLTGEPDLAGRSPSQIFDDLATGQGVALRLDDDGKRAVLLDYFERVMGIDTAWRDALVVDDSADASQLEMLMCSWALCVEFVHDLKRPPKDAILQPLSALAPPLVATACELAAHIRDRVPRSYVRYAGEIESTLPNEVREAEAEDLGRIDTFRFEDQKVFQAALVALEGKRWRRAADYAEARDEESSFWVRSDHDRRAGWQRVALMAALGLACEREVEALGGASRLDDAARWYSESGFEVDRAHRRLLQARDRRPLFRLDESRRLNRCMNLALEVYRDWADRQARALNALCRADGFLPEATMQQRMLFDDVVRPVALDDGQVAYFLVDALRFEMGAQLLESLGSEASAKLQLKPRYAELPTLTEVGMNTLAPLSRDGRLRLELKDARIMGFRAGETLVNNPDSRRRAMHERVGGETCPWLGLEDLLAQDVTTIRKRIARARLIVVHSEGLDKAGEKGVGLRHFEEELQRIRAAWGMLREAGVKSFVCTADHGFLLQDDETRRPLRHGKGAIPTRRHVIESHAADHEGEVRVSSTELRYHGGEAHFLFPDGSMPFDVGKRAKDFLHGGNSPQERIIPVITARYRHAKGGGTATYEIVAEAATAVLGLHRITGRVQATAQRDLAFGRRRSVELRLVALDGEDVAVELVDASGASIQGGALVAEPDVPFELFFRVTGPAALRTRIELAPAVPGEEISRYELERRFTVDVQVGGEPADSVGAAADEEWLAAIEDPKVRGVFAHIQRHNAINEQDATTMLGGPRQFRRFSQSFEKFAEKAPFEIRIDVSGGMKRYVKEGG